MPRSITAFARGSLAVWRWHRCRSCWLGEPLSIRRQQAASRRLQRPNPGRVLDRVERREIASSVVDFRSGDSFTGVRVPIAPVITMSRSRSDHSSQIPRAIEPSTPIASTRSSWSYAPVIARSSAWCLGVPGKGSTIEDMCAGHYRVARGGRAGCPLIARND
jgi:hypothetical protein